jgi:hypothetical protein
MLKIGHLSKFKDKYKGRMNNDILPFVDAEVVELVDTLS